MFTGKTIEDLIKKVQRAEREAREQRVQLAAKVTRYEAQPGLIYAMHFDDAVTRVALS